VLNLVVTKNMYMALACFVAGHTLAWFQLNSQFIWDYWKTRPLLAICLYSIPVGLLFWFGARYVYAETGDLWTGRFLAFSSSYMVFPVLTWILHNESPFTTKTMLCVGLSFMIMLIQVFWK